MSRNPVDDYIKFVFSASEVEGTAKEQVSVLSSAAKAFIVCSDVIRKTSDSGKVSASVWGNSIREFNEINFATKQTIDTFRLFFKEGANGFNGFSKAVAQIIPILIQILSTILGIASPFISDGISGLIENQKNLKVLTQDLGLAFRSMGKDLTQTGSDASDTLSSMWRYHETLEEIIADHANLYRASEKRIQDFNINSTLVDGYLATIHELAGKSIKTADAQRDLGIAVAGLNSICGTNIRIIDAANGMLSESVDSIDASTDAWKRSTMIQAQQEIYQDFQRSLTKVTWEREEAAKALAEAELKCRQATVDDTMMIHSIQLGIVKKKYEDCVEAENQMIQQLESLFTSMSEFDSSSTSTVEGLAAFVQESSLWRGALKENGIDSVAFSQHLSDLGISTGLLAAQSKDGVLDFIACFNQLPTSLALSMNEFVPFLAQEFERLFNSVGIDAALGFAEGLHPEVANVMARQLGFETLDALKEALDERSPSRKMVEIGSLAIKGFTDGMKSEQAEVESQASFISKAASIALNSEQANASSWGSDLVGGLAQGIRGAVSMVTGAASYIADSIKSFLHFSRPDKGPLRDYESWMPDMIGGLALSMRRAAPTVFAEAKDVAEGIEENINDWELSSTHLHGSRALGLVPSRNINTAVGSLAAINNYYTIGDLSYVPDTRVEELIMALFSEIRRNKRTGVYA